MANDYRKSAAAVKAEADAFAPLLNSGYIYIYDSTMPDGTTVALSTQSQIVRLTFGNPAFSTAVGGVLTAAAITAGNSTFSSTATFFRLIGNTTSNIYAQGTVGAAGCDLNLNSIVISSGASVSISAFTHTVPTS
jgi:hypothetical protein